MSAKKKIDEFIKIFSIFDITSQTWKSLSSLIRPSANNSCKFMKNKRYLSYLIYEESKKFDGIINHIKKESQNNLDEEIEITSSSKLQGPPKDIIKYDDLKFWFQSNDEDNQWICFDFKNKRVQIENYTIRSFDWGTNKGHLKNWVVEVSNNKDEENWIVIDKQENSSVLNGSNYVHTFPV